MANRYWIGGAGNWNDVTHWSDSSGGVGGASVPTSSDNVFFDNNSGTGTITVNAIASMLDFDVTGLAQNITLANAAYTFNVYGNFKLSNYLLTSFTSTGYLYFKATTSVGIWSNGTTKNWNRIYFDGVGGIWTNQDDWNAVSTLIYLKSGIWTTGDKIITINVIAEYSTGIIFTLNFGSSILNITNGLMFATSIPGLTVNAGTSTINIGGDWCQGGGKTYHTINYTKGTYQNTGVGNFTCSNFYHKNTNTFATIAANFTVTNQLTFEGTNSSNLRTLIASGTVGTPRTITCNGTIVASNVDFRDITLAGTANRDLSNITGGSGDCGGNSGIIFTPSQTLYFKHTSGAVNLSDSSKWFTTDGGSTLGRTPLPQDYAYFTANSFAGTSNITFNMPRFCGFDMSGVNQAVTLSQNMAIEFYGDYILGNNIITSLVYPSKIQLFGKSGVECKFNSYAKSLGVSYLRIIGGIYRNYSNIVMGNTATSQFHALRGTFYLNNYDLSCYTFTHTNAGESYFNCYFYAGSGTITVNGSGFEIYGVRFFAETSTIILNSIGTADISVDVGSIYGSLVTINKLILQGTITGNYIISQTYGSTTINELTINAGKKVKFQGGRTFSVGKITAKGTNTNKIIIGSTTTTKANITYTGGIQPDIKFADISYITATNPFKVRASTDSGNNTNITFNPAKFWVGGTGNINDTAHWSDTSGGAGGAVLPTLNDDVFFDENSLGADSQTITVNTQFDCLSLDFEYLVNTMTLTNAVYNFSVYGGLFLSTKLTASFSSTGYLYLKSTTSVPIYSNSNTSFWNRIYFDGVGGTWTNQDDWNTSWSEIHLTNGTWKTNGKYVFISVFNTGSGSKVLTLGSSVFELRNNWLNNIPQNFTFNYDTSTVIINGNSIRTSNTFYNLKIIGSSSITSYFNFLSPVTVLNELSLFGNNSTNYRHLIASNTIGAPRTITCNGTIIASNVDFRDITGAGTANWDLSAITGGSGDAGGNSGIIFTPSQTQYFKDVTYLDKLNGNGNFENGLIGTISLGTGQAATWTLNTVNPISGTRDGLLSVTVAGSSSARPSLTLNLNYTINKTYRWSFKYKVKSGSCRVIAIHNGTVNLINVNQTLVGEGTFSFDILALGTTQPSIYFANLIGETQIDDFKVEEINSYGWSESTNWFSNIERTIAGRVPLPQDDPIFDNLSFAGTSLLSVNVPRIGRSLNMELVNQAVTFSLVNNIECYGSFVLGNNIITNGNYSVLCLGRNGNFDLNSYGKYFRSSLQIQSVNGSYINKSILYIAGYLEPRMGTFDINDFDASFNGILGGRGNYGYRSDVLYLGNGIIELRMITDANYAWLTVTTVYAENSTIKLNPSSGSGNVKFEQSTPTIFNKVQFSGAHTGNFDISGSNTFAEIIIDPGRKVRFTNGTTQTINKLTVNSKPNNKVYLSSTTTSKFNLTTTSKNPIDVDFIDVSYSNVTPANMWYAGDNSVDSGNNSGWIFNSSFIPIIIWM